MVKEVEYLILIKCNCQYLFAIGIKNTVPQLYSSTFGISRSPSAPVVHTELVLQTAAQL